MSSNKYLSKRKRLVDAIDVMDRIRSFPCDEPADPDTKFIYGISVDTLGTPKPISVDVWVEQVGLGESPDGKTGGNQKWCAYMVSCHGFQDYLWGVIDTMYHDDPEEAKKAIDSLEEHIAELKLFCYADADREHGITRVAYVPEDSTCNEVGLFCAEAIKDVAFTSASLGLWLSEYVKLNPPYSKGDKGTVENDTLQATVNAAYQVGFADGYEEGYDRAQQVIEMAFVETTELLSGGRLDS